MEIMKKRISEMERAEYNPRVELLPGDDEYEKLKRNIDRFGMVVPVIWNRRTNRVVSGHQRLTVLENMGVEETEVSVVDLDEIERLENSVDDLVDDDFLDEELKRLEETFNISLKFSIEDREVIKAYIKDNGKEGLVELIIQKIRGEI